MERGNGALPLLISSRCRGSGPKVAQKRGMTDSGEVAEWPIAAVLKTVEPRGSVGSNPTLTAMFMAPWGESAGKSDSSSSIHSPHPSLDSVGRLALKVATCLLLALGLIMSPP